MPSNFGDRITQQSIQEIIDEHLSVREHDDLILKAKRIILSFDYEHTEHIMEKIDSSQLFTFINHLEKLKTLAEKALFNKS